MNMKNTANQEGEFLFAKKNYILVLVGVILMISGFLLMIGGGNPEPEIFNPEEKYGFVRTVLAPILILSGLFVEGVAIFTKKG